MYRNENIAAGNLKSKNVQQEETKNNFTFDLINNK